MLIAILQYLPIFGLGMTFFEFIFMNQKLASDYNTIVKYMKRSKELYNGFPLWLLIFPEGTLNTPNNRVTSRAYAKKQDIPEDPKVVYIDQR
jgi:1-acyl-sn-glycerol-3-phosphate acyltransferase